MNITNEILKKALPLSVEGNRRKYLSELNEIMPRYGITTPLRVAMFLAQVGHESGQLARVEENLNYSESGLLAVFPKYFNADTAKAYARNAEAIANIVYANRLGNGDTKSGDGWRYRGRGLIQLTGKSNYQTANAALTIGIVEHPERVKEIPAIAVLISCWWWKNNGLNEIADTGNVLAATRRINGGTNGLKERETLYESSKKALGI
ncbi:MAG: glycoside hydrolase family 19 protein [Bacteroidales bacterium]|jgi:putative chitinase|nr:glycoside hydrolase family 19 protein [Bacteroidales bacterium]